MAEHSNIAQPVEILKSKCGPDVSTHFEMKEWRETLEQQSRPPQTQKNRDKVVGFLSSWAPQGWERLDKD